MTLRHSEDAWDEHYIGTLAYIGTLNKQECQFVVADGISIYGTTFITNIVFYDDQQRKCASVSSMLIFKGRINGSHKFHMDVCVFSQFAGTS